MLLSDVKHVKKLGLNPLYSNIFDRIVLIFFYDVKNVILGGSKVIGEYELYLRYSWPYLAMITPYEFNVRSYVRVTRP